MKLEQKIHVFQFLLTICNCLYLILGASILGCASWILFDTGNLLRDIHSDELETVAGGLFLVGLLVLAVAALGYAAAHCQARLMLQLYMAFLIVLILGQLFISLVLLTSQKKIEGALDEAVDQMIISYAGGRDLTASDRLLDELQRTEKCCGRTGPDDWKTNLYIQNLTNQDVLPCACFNTSCPSGPGGEPPLFGASVGNDSYQEGCKEKITDWLAENALTIVAMDASIIILQVLQIILAVYLYKAVSQQSRVKGSRVLMEPEPDQTDPGPDLREDQGGFYGEENRAYWDPEPPHTESTGYPNAQNPYAEHERPGQGYNQVYY
ncbi:leukocyte antigen CD37 [Gadus macrocephalus]|uniref:leukocyte antigen CD37 n=1 Tax=Gadus macrocephalus TaxID=80720 RepID=UPI0028CB6EE2|nr:leukocyte antigen CD37 [Gadus macrocephalus]XP_059909369.1 leukocyte antigen CD37 [Gadus macrocephalus]XP_059909370.1 leukocyte antigen CD37 [Gadus macrocephalus]